MLIDCLRNGKEKEYKIVSYSKTPIIGKNLTLLKTEYGVIVFDCGAAVSSTGVEPILSNEIIDFLHDNTIDIDEIKAVIISHAHLDHYGSIMQFVETGIKYDQIFINYCTKRLIEKTSNYTIYGMNNMHSIAAFEDANIEIIPFSNGHILGSECYLVKFDNINILYTGDFCLHNQQTVKGLNYKDIIRDKDVEDHGIECIITETTYGLQKNHLTYNSAVEALKHFVKVLIDNNYKIFIPSFAIGRAQEIALILNDAYNIMIDGSAADISYLYEKLANINIYNANTRSNALHAVRISNFENNDIIHIIKGEKNNYTFTSINETAVLEMLDELLSLGETMLDNKININSHKYKEKCNQFFKLLSNHSQYENLLKNAKVCITTVKNCTIFFGIMLILHIHLFS